ncbi:protein TonB-like isoform X2 [Ornithodoros turicata]|uniref:protein TonB-like isoform X2 n=1 Tax=Ornithodoros turicata TaxID=34597 RepID=UPI00313A4863
MNKAKAAAVKPEPQVEPTRILAETVPLPAEQLAPPPVEQPALPLPEPAPQLEPQPVPEPAPKPTVRLVLPPPARPGQRLIQPTPTRHQPRARTAPSSKEAHPATAAGVIKSAGATALEGAAQQDVNKEQKPGTIYDVVPANLNVVQQAYPVRKFSSTLTVFSTGRPDTSSWCGSDRISLWLRAGGIEHRPNAAGSGRGAERECRLTWLAVCPS